MSKSVVTAAAAVQAKQLARSKKLPKRPQDDKAVKVDQHAADKDEDATHIVQVEKAHHDVAMSDTDMSSGFSFEGALGDAAGSASLAQADGTSTSQGTMDATSDDEAAGLSSTVLLVGAAGLAGLGIAIAASGGGDDDNGGTPPPPPPPANRAPAFTSGTTATVAENAANTTVIYTAAATDADGDAITYSLTGADAAAFNISSAGVVTLKNPADFETKPSYAFGVVASDGKGGSTTQNVALTVTDVAENRAPTFTSGTTATIAENAAVTTVVYTAAATDADGDPLTYTLTGADAAAFAISSAGVVTLRNSADFETKKDYAFGVVASDGKGGTTTQNVAVNVTDVAENRAPTFTSGATATVVENAAITTVVYTAAATDPDGDALTYTLTGADASAFNISSTGVVTLKAPANFEADKDYAFGVVASDGKGGTTTQNVAVSVTDVAAEGPVFVSGTAVNFEENTPTSNVVYDANANGSGTVTYSLTGTDAADFVINAQTGEVRFKVSPDFEDDASYSFGVVATDVNGATTQNVAVSITDVLDEANELSLDVGNPTSQNPVEVDVENGAFVLNESIGVNTNAVIVNFTEDDVIMVTGTDDLDDYAFTTGTGENASDLIITQQNAPAGTANIILIEDVLATSGFVFDYDSAAAAVGFDFMQLG